MEQTTGYEALDRILARVRANSMDLEQKKIITTSYQMKIEEEPKKNLYNCPYCKDTTWIIDIEDKAKRCKCYEIDYIRAQWEASGLKVNDLGKTFKTYNAFNDVTKKLKNTATNYYLRFEKIEKSLNNSILLCGDPGAGKTHLCISLANNFLKQKNRKVVYMSYLDAVKELKHYAMDKENYNRLIDKYKSVEILLIDDLFKGGVTAADIRIAFEIINHRYINKLPMIVSSELTIKEILDVDEAIGSRIYEMAKDFTVEVKGNGTENNYRLRGSND